MRAILAALVAAVLGLAVLPAPALAGNAIEKVEDSAAPAIPPAVDDGAEGAPASTLPIPTPVETPFFADAVAAGKLPPVAERLPRTPRVVDLPAMGRQTGRPGGTWRMLMSDQRDLRFMTVFSYTRLVVFDEKLRLTADILQSLDNQDDKVFTLHLRPGHRWSDGQPFTAEDFRYWWEDFANDKKLSPSGPPLALIANGKPPRFEVLDPETVRYTWDDPNPGFIPAIASANPTFIFMPAHYLKQFHAKYADKDELAKLVKAAKVSGWVALHERKSRQYRGDNPDLPTLDPWRNTTYAPAEQFRFERNPYFHRVDSAGHQLPYFDGTTLTLGTPTLIPAKTAAGDADIQARYLNFEDYTFLKAGEKVHNYSARLWEDGHGAFAALFPNLNAKDETWRNLNRDVRFRRALSLGINRADINNVLFFGLARVSADTVLPQSPLFKPELAEAYATYDVAKANALLDEVGLTKRDTDGTRLLPDGRRAEITVETSGDNQIYTDIMELVGSDWAKLGIRAYVHPSHLDIFRQRIASGSTVMSMDVGMDNAVPTAEFEPNALAPTQDSQYQWPEFGLYVQSSGSEGRPADMPEVKKLEELWQGWRRADNLAEQRAVWRDMLQLNADQVFAIGVVNGTRQPVVVSNRIKNVPETALWSFQPSSYFGLYMPDTFFYADSKG
ncbi:ABC transporter substrate-binding protein [Lichenibacterium dinghuense]|uniref:ABC transporter substrate-binding protein n=1 Tax=Lichenibacterium dinghuense TaxID=2895977 RepID=UPI001F419460|nr:ABC transporter substrate-binding protein [Lichenibacterium sp. 6Y81]